jgi:hypothetical protein
LAPQARLYKERPTTRGQPSGQMRITPLLESLVLVAPEPSLAAELSSLVAHPGYYFPVFDEPGGPHPNSETLFQRTVNAIARAKPEKLILAGVSAHVATRYAQRMPDHSLLHVQSAADLVAGAPSIVMSPTDLLHWGRGNIGIGLLSAKQSHCRLVIDLKLSPSTRYLPGSSGHLVVCEEGDDLLPVVAANYAFSLGAGLQMVAAWDRNDADRINEQFLQLDTHESEYASREELLRHMRTLAPEIAMEGVECITFFTKIPWGFVFNSVPTCHLPPNDDIASLTIVDAIAFEHLYRTGTVAALLIDPGRVDASEDIDQAARQLGPQGTLLRAVRLQEATVAEVACFVQFFPYDLLVFSSHAGEVEGNRLTFRFTDSKGVDREMVVDNAMGFAWDPVVELVRVVTFDRFVSIDGVPWDDTARKKKSDFEHVVKEFVELRTAMPPLKEADKKPIERVRYAMALRMYDGNYIPILHSVAGGENPVIINNSCNSWNVMAVGFLFGGARAYLGSLFQISDREAADFTAAILAHCKDANLAEATHRAHLDVYGSGHVSYVLFGPHFCTIRPPRVHPVRFVIESLKQAADAWSVMTEEHNDEGVRRNAARAARFCRKELTRVTSWARDDGRVAF